MRRLPCRRGGTREWASEAGERQPRVVVVDANLDTVRLLLAAFRSLGFVAAGCNGNTLRGPGLHDPARPGKAFDFRAFIRRHSPEVVVFDVDVPYEHGLRRLRHFRHTVLGGIPLLVTTTDGNGLGRYLARDEVERVFVKPYDVIELVAAARHALEGKLTPGAGAR